MQSLSIAVQRGNAASVLLGTFAQGITRVGLLEWLFFYFVLMNELNKTYDYYILYYIHN